jgi:hypothetical protein
MQSPKVVNYSLLYYFSQDALDGINERDISLALPVVLSVSLIASFAVLSVSSGVRNGVGAFAFASVSPLGVEIMRSLSLVPAAAVCFFFVKVKT